jgi:hypothetical protein
LKKSALADLKIMDSFLKETQRMKPILIGKHISKSQPYRN